MAPSDPTLADVYGITVNYTDPVPVSNKRSTLYGVSITFTIICWICVTLRLYARLFVIKVPGMDDLVAFLFLLTTTCGAVGLMVATSHGLGEHWLTLTVSGSMNFLKAYWIANAAYMTSTALIKLSLLLQYSRTFEPWSLMRRLCIGLIVFDVLWGAAFAFIAWFPCFPVAAFWDGRAQSSDVTCYGFGMALTNHRVFTDTYYAHGALNTALDLIVLLLPAPLLLRSSTPRRTRMGIAALLGVGLVITILSVCRIAELVKHQAGTSPTMDPTWWGPISMLLALLEVDLASICASVPIFWPVFEEALGLIVVTHEVQVVHTDPYPPSPRGPAGGSSRLSGNNDDDAFSVAELTKSPSSQRVLVGVRPARADSDTELHEMNRSFYRTHSPPPRHAPSSDGSYPADKVGDGLRHDPWGL